MKRLGTLIGTWITLLVVFGLWVPATTHVQAGSARAPSCGWCQVGSGAIVNAPFPPVGNPAIAADPAANTVWMAWLQPVTGGDAVTVARYSPGDTQPTPLQINTIPAAQPEGVALSVYQGSPVVAFVSAAPSNAGDLVTWRANADGSWSQLGSSVEAESQFPTQPSLAVSGNGTLGIAWQEGPGGNSSICYKQLVTGSSPAWKALGTGSACGQLPHDSDTSPSLAFSNGLPVIAFIDSTSLGGLTETVQVADVSSGGQFTFTPIPDGGGSGQQINSVDLTGDGSTLYLAWSQTLLQQSVTTVNSATRPGDKNAWSLLVGPDGKDPIVVRQQGDDALSPSIAIGTGDVPWLTWTERSGSNTEVDAAWWDSHQWQFVGTGIVTTGVPVNAPTALAFVGPTKDLAATPYLLLFQADGAHLMTWTGATYSRFVFDTASLPTGLTAHVTLGNGTPVTLPAVIVLEDNQTVNVSVTANVPTPSGAVYGFQGWGGSCAGCLASTAAATTSLTVTRGGELTATYHLIGYQVTFTSNLPNSAQPWSITVNGTSCSNPCSAVVPAGTVFFSYPSVVSDTNPAERYVLLSTNPSGSFTVNTAAPTTVSASYKTQYQLTLQSNPSGVGNPQTAGGNQRDWYDVGAKASISTAAAVTDSTGIVYAFAGWSSSPAGAKIDSASSPSTAVTMDQPYTLTASYTPATVHVQFTTQGLPTAMQASVSLDGSDCALPCAAPLVSGTSHQFSYPATINDPAHAGIRYVLSTVQGGSSPLTVKGDATVTAVYTTQYLIAVQASDASIPGAQLGGAGWVDAGSTVSLSAPPCVPACTHHTVDRRLSLTGWTGATGITSTGAGSATFTASGPATVIATYVTQYRVTVRGKSGTTTPQSTDYYTAGSQLSIATSPSRAPKHARFVFAGWKGTGTGAYSGTRQSATITVNGPIKEIARWRVQYRVTIASAGLPGVSATVTVGSAKASLRDGHAYDTWANKGARVSVRSAPFVNGSTGTRYAFTRWTGRGAKGAGADVVVTVKRSVTLTAHYSTQYYLWTFARNGSVRPTAGWETSGQTVTLSTMPSSAGLRFGGWQGRGKGSYTGPARRPAIHMAGPIVETAIWQR